MSEQLIQYSFDSVEIDNVTKFTEFLSSASSSPVKPSISILPNIIKDFLGIALENKKINVENRQFREKIKVINRMLDIHESSLKSKHKMELDRMKADTQIRLHEIESDREVSLIRIEAEKEMALDRIASDERTKMTELHVQYEVAQKEQEHEMSMFKQELQESSRRFNKLTEFMLKEFAEKQKLRKDFDELLKVIKERIEKRTVTNYEMDLFIHLTTLKVESFKSSFDLTEGLINMFNSRS